MFTGSDQGRHGRTEKLLPRLVQGKRLVAVPYGRKLVYSVPRRCRGRQNKSFYRIEHGLACTECLVRTWLSDTKGIIFPEQKFRKAKVVPDWGISYAENSTRMALMFEFSSEDNFNRLKLMNEKIARYAAEVDKLARGMSCKDGFILFVCDVSRDKVSKFVEDNRFLDDFFFVDYETFLTADPLGQLAAPIYIWGGDGKEYPLNDD
jgi:hypothetical protein